MVKTIITKSEIRKIISIVKMSIVHSNMIKVKFDFNDVDEDDIAEGERLCSILVLEPKGEKWKYSKYEILKGGDEEFREGTLMMVYEKEVASYLYEINTCQIMNDAVIELDYAPRPA